MAVVTAYAEFVICCGACRVALAYRRRRVTSGNVVWPHCLEHPDGNLVVRGSHMYLLEIGDLRIELSGSLGQPARTGRWENA